MQEKKEPEHICANCALYRWETRTCPIRLLYEGETIRNIPMHPSEKCIWEENGLLDYIEEVRLKVVDPKTGEPTTGDGKVLIEYTDENFFGRQSS